MSDRTAIHTGVEGTDHPVEQTDASGKSRRKAEEQAAVRVGEPALRSEEQPSRAKDEKHLVLKRILAAHEQWFDVRRGYEYAGRTFPGYAEFHSYGEKYVLVKRAKLWEVDTITREMADDIWFGSGTTFASPSFSMNDTRSRT